MIHEWWGLNEHIQLQAEKLSQDGQYVVLAVDLYEGAVAEKREEAAKLMQSVDEKKARRTLQSAIQYLTDGNEFAFTKIGVVGWCFGGGWSLQTALLGGQSIGACVIYYGWPETSPDRLKNLECPVLGIFGKQDTGISAELVGKFEAAMKSAGKKLDLRWYDAPHAFANPSNPAYNKDAADDAWQRVLAFLRANVKG
jgi:carboxymethylenebutenolidase